MQRRSSFSISQSRARHIAQSFRTAPTRNTCHKPSQKINKIDDHTPATQTNSVKHTRPSRIGGARIGGLNSLCIHHDTTCNCNKTRGHPQLRRKPRRHSETSRDLERKSVSNDGVGRDIRELKEVPEGSSIIMTPKSTSRTMPFPADFVQRLHERQETKQRLRRVKTNRRAESISIPRASGKRRSFMASSAGVGINKPYIRVCVFSGRNLAAHDFRGTSDPYCIVKLLDYNGKPLFSGKTHVEWKTLNPHFGNTNFAWSLEDDICDKINMLRIEVFDKDKYLKDDFMGYVEFDLSEENPSTKPEWFPLKERKVKDKVSGELFLEVDYRSKRMYEIDKMFTRGIAASNSPSEKKDMKKNRF